MSRPSKNSLITIGLIALLLVGLPAAFFLSQTPQDTRSKAADGTTVTANNKKIAGNVNGDLLGNDNEIDGDVNGNLLGNDNQVDGGVNGDLIGDDNKVDKDVKGDLIGDNNNVDGNVNGCVIGNNNEIDGNVGGKVTGSKNEIDGKIKNGPCLGSGNEEPPTNTPTPVITATIPPSSRCADNIDNDNNGVKDAADSSCHTDGNPNNPNSYDPNKNGENGGGGTCADSKDNDSDGKIDGADEDCHTDGNPNNPGSYDPDGEEGPAPTPTISPTSANLSFTIFMHGIGLSGDNSNPNGSALSNKNPKHPLRDLVVEVFDSSNNPAGNAKGEIDYRLGPGNFTGTVNVPNVPADGIYTVKVSSTARLRRLLPGIITIKLNENNVMPPVHMIAGDIVQDNALNILDYNVLIGCYSDLQAASSCNGTDKILADLDDDGNVNQRDYNLFLRELTVQNGQ